MLFHFLFSYSLPLGQEVDTYKIKKHFLVSPGTTFLFFFYEMKWWS